MEANPGLYRSEYEHDACGVGFIANIKGQKSHSIVSQGLEILKNLTHRGAVGADPLQGDGAGILIQLPDKLYRDDMASRGIILPPCGEYGVGMVFLPQEEASRHACEEEIERAILAEGQIILGWRDVPVNKEIPMSPVVRQKEPVIRQIFVGHSPDILVTDALERKLYIIRKSSSIAIANLNLKHCKEFYISSFSARTIVYKGQLLANQVGVYYKDLSDSRCVSAVAMIHQRFSTNTFPQWALAHPFRMIAHNGEINTLRGNFNWIRAREKNISSPVFGRDLEKLWPLIFQGQSDSASFDNVFELLTMSGYSLAQAAMMMIPSAWEKDRLMDRNLKAFYEYYAAMMEPWDGPAAVVFTDGRQIGATLDRNGLRPARYIVTKDDMVILASEEGTLNIDESRIANHLRLEPGRMLLIDMEQGRIIGDSEVKNLIATARPYQEWTDKVRIRLDDIKEKPLTESLKLNTKDLMRVFGYTREDVERLLKTKALSGQEPVVSMGNDAPLAILSSKPSCFYDYFRQLFAQVTNPAIDPIREEMVTSLVSFIGPRPDLLNIMDNNPPVRLEVDQPILSSQDIEKIRNIGKFTGNKFRSVELDITYPVSWGKNGIEARLASIRAAAVDAVKTGNNILILSDRNVSRQRLAIPALLATSAVHQCLVEKGLRTSTGLVVETGSARTVHHFALLGGYGAEAVHPYVALNVVASLGKDAKQSEQFVDNYIHAIDKGLYKTMSKMGISTYMSYIGAQIFEAVGLSSEFVDKYFKNTPSPIEGVNLFDIADEAVKIHRKAFEKDAIHDDSLDQGGELNWRYDGQEHMWTPDAVVHLQRSVRSGDYEEYRKYAQIINDQSKRLMTLRGLFSFKKTKPIDISEVESEESIIHHFACSAMSIGAISTEAHTTMAIAMNRLGAMSNSGEGGEDPRRDTVIDSDTSTKAILGDDIVVDIPLHKGDSLRSKTRQVASGRFGVTTDYLSGAELIQIKLAQGAKPGEGGQLPGHKVSPYIGKLRHSLPGIGLISPPPHHDIYSIEDLAQLIFDLKLANTRADISVKLVSEVGIGTVAAGVAKCKADHIVISGHDGGTGAAPASSVKYAGSAWEIGLADVQQTLVMNKLRSRVKLQVDGQIKTGRDVIIGALLGADEFGFGTAPLVCMGCTIMRKCQKNTCPTGIATQDPELRKQFIGRPEHLENYFHFVAREVRELLAQLGFRKLDDLIGHAELLEKNEKAEFEKARNLSFERIFYVDPHAQDKFHHVVAQQHDIDSALDKKFETKVQTALSKDESVTIESSIGNTNRSFGTYTSGLVSASKKELPDDFISYKLKGIAGQSFGAFLKKGVSLSLCGTANDYVGKGLSGGTISVYKSSSFEGDPQENIIAGNTCLYGATSGKAFFSGVLGERFAVRNSGVDAVCEGCGDHGCEYMTGGTVMVLGRTGRNFGAGMTGGIAYVYDPENVFRSKLANGDFDVENVVSADKADPLIPLHKNLPDEVIIKDLLKNHLNHTSSRIAKKILENFSLELGNFVKVFPHEYLNALKSLKEVK
ncbi:glutamate synthase (NADPH/NADH) large chain [Succinivibrio dextrinosolvens DSM 3072]|uniref:Glutamate synthase [NADPH] large chain n=1 Tax=Succinivibrio dextrinosolvens DSM 3072 TaxID=1123324 RepID=A0A1T4UVE5_9GAMM|nr:glutamate synthase-related protein [Succinivibrio dextrinosolvens]SKA56699.1 glutamate synthase (NADPH/NADH) large chain [Succinivibrio dextrinosolvens DSM 3072]